ncbi:MULTISPECIES: chemotaxis protein CheD [unclassified Hyphomicrobium]|uniref:chemotaxis protein CheD n=1 Tax=unclassified Hyphomicrobium TaxID=2619925 RepID=UPI000213D8C7|nr:MULTISPECIES: chemotaxis protein CheD [unclassified Hyphomicrobium]CCB67514.1 putative chemoreceptor glutamine deamidase CheD [Hyphomicrobium sp. MC1]
MTTASTAEKRVHIIQGEFFVTDDRNVMVTTILGSCVAACIRDPLAGVGGINHFLLPGELGSTQQAERMGVHLMELLVNGLLKAGARRDRLEAKVFGGARTVRSRSDIGKNNADFAMRFLKAEGITYVGGSTGGAQGRRIQYWPVSGRARQILLTGPTEIERPVKLPVASLVDNAGELELF